jgi:hypothetical protein
MEGTWKTNQHYRELRDAFLLGNEGFRTIAYFDTVGVPTNVNGVALLARKKKDNKDKKPGRRFAPHDENLKAFKQVLGADSPEYHAIDKLAQQALKAIDHTPEPDYHGGKKTVRAFQSSERGKNIVRLLGPLNKRWEPPQSPSISDADAHKVSSEVIDIYEKELDGLLRHILDPAKLTEEQRIALLDALYHGKWSSGRKAAKAIKDGKSIEVVCQYLNDPGFPDRSRNVALLLKGQWQPSKPKKNIPPSRSVKEPGISAEQLSILREYLLAQSLSQPIGCTAYEQVLGRYMGAGSDVPLKNPCDPYGDVERRYGD